MAPPGEAALRLEPHALHQDPFASRAEEDGAPAGNPSVGGPPVVDLPIVATRPATVVESSGPAGTLATPLTASPSAGERSSGDPGERPREHDWGVRPEALSTLAAARSEHAHESAPASASAPSGPASEAVVRQIVPHVAALPRTGRHEIVLRLDPPSLGTVHIEAALDGRDLTLRIRAEDAAARDLLEQGLPRLRQALEQEGLTASRVSVQLGLEAGTRHPAHGAPFPRPLPIASPEPAPVAATRAPRAAAYAVSSTALDLWV